MNAWHTHVTNKPIAPTLMHLFFALVKMAGREMVHIVKVKPADILLNQKM